MMALRKWISWLKIMVFCLLCTFVAPVVSAADDPNNPNILYIMTDQQRFDAMTRMQEELSDYDGKVKIRTPNLDRLSFGGAYFRNAYSQCPVCGPDRTSLRTGCTLERTGVQSNDLTEDDVILQMQQFEDKINSVEGLDQILVEDYGYISEYYGKWHMPNRLYFERTATTPVSGTPQVIDYNDYNYSSGSFTFVDDESWSRKYQRYLAYFDDLGEISKTFTGVEQADTYSKYAYTPIQLDARYGYPCNTPLTEELFPGRTSQPNVQGWFSFSERYTPMHLNGEVAVIALDRLAQQNDPFILTASFHNPHAPMIPALEYLNHYWDDRDNLFVSPSISDMGNNSAYFPENSLISWGYSDSDKVKEWVACYYAMIEQIDDYIGQMLDKLDEHGIADNTLIVFTSDHGEMLGAHASREKNKFVEESAHIPMLISFPGRVSTNTVVEEPVSQLDLFATILDYTGKSASDNGDGTSLRRFIERTRYNETYDEEAVVSEWDFRKPLSENTLDRTLGGETNFLLRKGKYKLMMTKLASSSRLDMMYNLATDPYEVDNLVGNDGMTASDEVIGKAEHLKCLLIEWMERMDGPDNLYSDPVWNAGQGAGDIAEITARRKWKTLNIWVSDTEVEVGLPVDVSGQLTRNEYVYLGRTTSGTLDVSAITVEGADAGLIQLSEFTAGSITQGNYERVKLTYRPTYYGQPILDARVVISHDAGDDKVIELSSIVPPNAKPKITSVPTLNVDETVPYSYTLSASDLDHDDILTFTGVTVPSWLSFDTNTLVLSGTPLHGDIGFHPVVLRVNDGFEVTDDSFTIIVSSLGNDAPFFTSVPDTGVIEDQDYSYTVSATDADGDELTYGVTNRPSWLSFNAETRVLSGTPAPSDVGLHLVTLTVQDGTVTVTQQFNIAVFTIPVPSNLLQNSSFETGDGTGWLLNEMSVSSVQASHGTYSLYVYGTGVDTVRGNPRPNPDLSIKANTDYVVTYDLNYVSGTGACVVRLNNMGNPHVKSVTSSPTSGWVPKTLSFNSGANTTLRMELYCDGTPSANFVAYLDNFVIAETGAAGNMVPVITSIPITNVNAGAAYSYTLMAADAEEDLLTFSKVTVPAWLDFNAESGVLSGIPTNEGNYAVEIDVSDGKAFATQSFMITVDPIVLTGYETWAAANGVTGGPAGDDDGDGLKNLFEYAVSEAPTLAGAGGLFNYIYLRRNDDSNLIYRVETTSNLLSGGWVSAEYTVLETNALGGAYEEVVNEVPTEDPNVFIRLKVESP